ncbi:MAG TPA: FAD-binding domain [Hyphomonadaceae bacterium]|nr:FAD-binding domain [Hyphomonadaceae bacterium]
MDILISGMGIAGPTLAYWLRRAGHSPVVVEQASRLRRGGYIIDFWGLGYDIAERMGLIPRLNDVGYFIKEVRLVNERGARAGGFSASVFQRATDNRFVSLPRSELSAAIYDAIRNDVEVVWGDSISDIGVGGARAPVTFESGRQREFDLLIGADGLHSNVRRLGFGEEKRFETYLNYKVAAFQADGYRPRDDDVYVAYTRPGRQVARFSMRDDLTLFLFVFHDDSSHMPPHDAPDEMKRRLRSLFGDMGWECSQILDAMDASDQLYFDRVSQIRMDDWSNGRLCLLGDAAAAPSLLAGEGAALAMIEAYVLAGELRGVGSDPAEALRRYETRLRPFVVKKQKSAERFASSFAPKTEFGIAVRTIVTRAFDVPFVADLFLGSTVRDDFVLPGYDFDA